MYDKKPRERPRIVLPVALAKVARLLFTASLTCAVPCDTVAAIE